MCVNQNIDMQDLKITDKQFKQPQGPFDDWIAQKIIEFQDSYPDVIIRQYYNSYLDSYLVHMRNNTKLSKSIERFISCALLEQGIDSDIILYELTKMREVLETDGRT